MKEEPIIPLDRLKITGSELNIYLTRSQRNKLRFMNKTIEQLKTEKFELETKIKDLISEFMAVNEGYGIRISTVERTTETYCGKTSYTTVEAEIYVL